MPGIKNSNQAICLQMAAAKEWGQANYARLDPFTITLPHPDAAIAIISRSTELAGHYGVSPFQDYELAAPGMHAVLKSYDTLGGPTTNGVVFMAKKFRDANPKVTSAVYAAFDEVVGVHQQGAAPERRDLHPHDQREALRAPTRWRR